MKGINETVLVGFGLVIEVEQPVAVSTLDVSSMNKKGDVALNTDTKQKPSFLHWDFHTGLVLDHHADKQ